MKITNVALLLLLFLISGCSTTILDKEANFQKNNLLKKQPVSVVVNDGFLGTYGDLRTGAITQGVVLSFKDSGLFERVDVNNAYANYVFDIKIKETEATTAQSIGAIASAATLFLVPATMDNTITMDTIVRSKNKVLKKYTHKIKVKERTSLLQDPQKKIYQSMKVLTSYLFRDIQKDKIIN